MVFTWDIQMTGLCQEMCIHCSVTLDRLEYFLKMKRSCENLCLPGLKSNGLVISGVKMRKIRMIKVEYGTEIMFYLI